MPLWGVYYRNGDHKVIHTDTSGLKIKDNPEVEGHQMISVHKYRIESPTPPGIVRLPSGIYITPTWERCHPKTTLKDIIWDRPKKKRKKEDQKSWTVLSSNKVDKYTVRRDVNRFTCTCPGYFRSKKRECKHIRGVKEDLGLT